MVFKLMMVVLGYFIGVMFKGLEVVCFIVDYFKIFEV